MSTQWSTPDHTAFLKSNNRNTFYQGNLEKAESLKVGKIVLLMNLNSSAISIFLSVVPQILPLKILESAQFYNCSELFEKLSIFSFHHLMKTTVVKMKESR